MQKIFSLLVAYSFLFNSAFATNPNVKVVKKGKTSLIIRSFVSEYSKKIEEDIQKYNRVRRDPSSFLKTFPQKEEKQFLNILKQYRIQELPEVKKANGKYIIQVENNKAEFDLVDSFSKRIVLNGKVYKFQYESLEKEHQAILSHLGVKTVKSSFLPNLLIDNAHAMLGAALLVGALLVGALAMRALFAQGGESKELGKQLKEMEKNIKNLELQCQEDIQFVGKPEEVKETLSILSLFVDGDKIQEDALENHLYSRLAGEAKDFKEVKNFDPVDCKEFADLLKRTTYTATDAKMEKRGLLDDITGKLCTTHDSLKSCLIDFHDKFRSSNGNRSIEDLIDGYQPHNELLKKSLDK